MSELENVKNYYRLCSLNVFLRQQIKSTFVPFPSSTYLQFAGLARFVETQIEKQAPGGTLKTQLKKNKAARQRIKERSDVRYCYYIILYISDPSIQQKDYRFLTSLTERLESQNLSTPKDYETNYRQIISVSIEMFSKHTI